MNFKTSFILIVCLAAAVVTLANPPRPNFSGTWELDQKQSHSIPPDMKQTMTVVHDGDKVAVETKITNAQGERVVKDAYALDGKEIDFTPPSLNPNATPLKGKRKGSWFPDGRGFFLEEEVQTKSPDGKDETILVARKWIMWPDGTMSIETINESARGTFNNKRLFVRKK